MLGVIQRYADEDKAAAEKKAMEVMFYFFVCCRLKVCSRPPPPTASICRLEYSMSSYSTHIDHPTSISYSGA